MRNLVPQDFKLKTIDHYRVKYFECMLASGAHLVIEPVKSGYDVSLFDENGIRIYEACNVRWSSGAPEHKPVKATRTFERAVQAADGFHSAYRIRLSHEKPHYKQKDIDKALTVC